MTKPKGRCPTCGTVKPEGSPVPRTKRQQITLECTVCGMTMNPPGGGFLDPTQGDGWPQHKCADSRPHPFNLAYLEGHKPGLEGRSPLED
jgi:hypothetical protein